MSEAPAAAVLADIARCNRCGFCLPACPTYRLTGEERHAPRGRIALVEALVRGEVPADAAVADALDLCLGCRACETACPSGVAYHRIWQAGKARIREALPGRARLPFLPRQALRLVRRPRRLKRALALAGRLRRLPWPPGWRRWAPMLGYRPLTVTAPRPAPAATPVAFFTGCVQEAAFPDANRAAAALLTAAGYRVEEPPGQGCCGALALHAGRTKEARALARANLDAFAGFEGPVANTAGGCGAMLSEYGELLADDPAYRERARAFGARVRDWSTLLAARPPLKYQGDGSRVTLQNSCHLVNVEQAGEDPTALLAAVEGDIFTPIPGQDRCCGSAGVYNLTHPDTAFAILDARMEEVDAVRPDRVLVNNPGCQLQMRVGVSRSRHAPPPVVEHVAVYLYRAWLRAQAASAPDR